MNYVLALLCFLTTYLLFCKIWPYFLYPNYSRKAKVEKYPELVELSLRLKGDDQAQTFENVHEYMQQTYSGQKEVFKVKNLLSVFRFGDFETSELLDKKQFLWCHTQNRLSKSLLVGSGTFKESDVVVRKRLFTSFFIHQWLVVSVDDREIVIDPYYNIFNSVGVDCY